MSDTGLSDENLIEQITNVHSRKTKFEHLSHSITDSKKLQEGLKQLYRSIMENVHVAITLIDIDYKILIANRTIGEKFNKPVSELIGRKCFREFEKREAICLHCPGKQAIATGQPAETEAEGVRDDGSRFPVRIQAFPAVEPDGTVTGFIEVIEDITERKKAEEALIASELRYRTTLNSMRDAIHVVDTDLRIVLINDRMKQWTKELGIKMNYPVGRKIKDVFSFLPDKTFDEYQQVFKNGKVLTAEESIEIAGKHIITETRKIPIFEAGRVVRVVTVVRDITERREAARVRLNHLRFLESLDQVNRAIQGASGLNQMMTDVLDAALSIFNCDRAWLLYPCDPEAPSWRVPMERTVPEYPGALALGVDVAMDQGVAGVLRTVLASDGPVKFHPGSEHPLPEKSAKQFGFQSQISMAIHPKVGNPWMFGLHQCSYQRLWTEEEEKLLQEVGRRIADAMSSLLTLRDLRESRERYRALVDNTNLGIALINTDFEVLMSNAAQGRMIQKDHRDFIGGKCHFEFEKRDEVCPHCPGRRAMESGHTNEVETEGVRTDGTKISVRVQASPVYGEGGRVDGFVEIVEDITDRRQAEQKLLEDQAQLKSLASQLSLTEERERREIATELHDRIGQSLVISKIKLDELSKSVSSDDLTETLCEICDCLEQVIQDTRTLTFDLSSPILYELGFEAAVAEWLNEQIQEKYGVKTEFEDDQQPKPLDDDIRVLLFRNVRELLINVVKHSNARNVKVSVSKAGERIIVRVEDDGVGFDPAEAASKAAERATFGLFSIQERLEQLEGHLEIDSAPGRGSRITMTAPLKCKSINDKS